MTQVGHNRGDLLIFQEINQTSQHRLNVSFGASSNKVTNRIDDHRIWLELAQKFLHRNQVHFQAVLSCTHRTDLQSPLLNPWFQVDPYGLHVSDDLARRLFESKVNAFSTAPAN